MLQIPSEMSCVKGLHKPLHMHTARVLPLALPQGRWQTGQGVSGVKAGRSGLCRLWAGDLDGIMDGWLHGWMDGRWCRVLRVPPFQCEDLRGPCLYVCLLWGLSKVCGASTSRLHCLCDPAVARGMLSGEWQTGNATCHSTQVLATSAHSAHRSEYQS